MAGLLVVKVNQQIGLILNMPVFKPKDFEQCWNRFVFKMAVLRLRLIEAQLRWFVVNYLIKETVFSGRKLFATFFRLVNEDIFV